MANVLAPFGFQPIRRLDGASWTANMTVRKIASNNSTAIFKGDVVKSLNTGYIAQAAANDTQIAGVFVGCQYLSTSQSRTVWSPYWPGSDTTQDVTAYIIDDPLCVFLAQSGGGSGSPVGLSAIGDNIKITTATAGNTANGISGMALDDANIATTSTYPFRIIDIPGVQVANLGASVNGYDTTTKYNFVIVAFNSQDFKSLTGI
jgi:hypothetical protein